MPQADFHFKDLDTLLLHATKHTQKENPLQVHALF